MQRLFATLVIAAPLAGFAPVGPAHALPIIQTVSLSTGTADAMLNQPSGPAAPLFDLFDPTLGTLDYVDIRVIGAVSLNWIFPPCLCQPPNNGPLPYGVSGFFTQTLGGSHFDLAIDPFFVYSVFPATAGGAAFAHDYNFRFDATSDLIGLTTAHGNEIYVPGVTSQGVTPGIVNGRREEFVGPGIGALLNRWTFQRTSSPPPGLVNPGTLTYSYSGTMLITYEYTPTPPVSVPEPGSLALLGLGLGALAFVRRRTAPASAR